MFHKENNSAGKNVLRVITSEPDDQVEGVIIPHLLPHFMGY